MNANVSISALATGNLDYTLIFGSVVEKPCAAFR